MSTSQWIGAMGAGTLAIGINIGIWGAGHVPIGAAILIPLGAGALGKLLGSLVDALKD